MNEGFFIGQVIYVDKFKFIYSQKLIHKSVISIMLRLQDGEIVNFKGFDDIADKILRNDFKFVYIYGRLRTNGYIQIEEINEI